MSDIAVNFSQQPIEVIFGSQNVQTTLAAASLTVQFGAQNINAAMSGGITVQFPVAVAPSAADFEAAVAAWPEYISNEAALADSVNAYRAAAGHEGAYPGTLIYTEQ